MICNQKTLVSAVILGVMTADGAPAVVVVAVTEPAAAVVADIPAVVEMVSVVTLVMMTADEAPAVVMVVVMESVEVAVADYPAVVAV